MKIDLAGKVALVTGAAEGIGGGISNVLADAGAHVVVNDIQVDKGQKMVEAIRQRGGSAEFIAADVSDEIAVRQMFDDVKARHSSLHILINNAGIALFKGLADTESTEWDHVVSVDVKGIYLVTRHALPLLKSTKAASIINIASVHAILTVDGMTAYAAAKGAVVAMVRSLAQEFGRDGIRVNAVSPGFVDTWLFHSWLEHEPDPQASMARVKGLIPTGRITSVDEVGNLVAFLCSDLAPSITGMNYIIDGGLTCRLMH
jgi:NAD(P)-dependent dehydrogenase (short-subunit alcohol dehydrogenase family)